VPPNLVTPNFGNVTDRWIHIDGENPGVHVGAENRQVGVTLQLRDNPSRATAGENVNLPGQHGCHAAGR
jgi:hypothetical protein